jgi:hypothetical protein
MPNWTERIGKLDISLFEAIPSQTSNEDRRSLLAVQRATAQKYKEYIYLEIGSFLGGSIQPHLVDDRCRKIYSIDPRPAQLPDDRMPGLVSLYDNNSTERMLSLLRGIGSGDVAKIECFDMDASKVDPGRIESRPQIAFIDGEHTKSAALSDFHFCSKILSDKGAILFHDFNIIAPAIAEIGALLDKQGRKHVRMKLEDSVYAIFFDPELVAADPFLDSLHKRQGLVMFSYRIRKWLRKWLPTPLLNILRRMRNAMTKSAGQGA